MNVFVAGIAVGTPYKGIGVTVIDAATGAVVEAVTINPESALGDDALPDLLAGRSR